jgi:hypothetical protein
MSLDEGVAVELNVQSLTGIMMCSGADHIIIYSAIFCLTLGEEINRHLHPHVVFMKKIPKCNPIISDRRLLFCYSSINSD